MICTSLIVLGYHYITCTFVVGIAVYSFLLAFDFGFRDSKIVWKDETSEWIQCSPFSYYVVETGLEWWLCGS